jgi:AmmeMemoRadiSam system protein B
MLYEFPISAYNRECSVPAEWAVMKENPKFRPINPQPASAQGQPILVLQDPLQLSDRVAYLPRALAPMLALCDGSRTVNEIQASLMIRAGLSISLTDLNGILDQLDQVLLLENRRSAAAIEVAVEAYRAAPFRAPSLAGAGYPADPDETRQFLDHFLEENGSNEPAQGLRGLVSPHIDYQRGGPVYAQVWSYAAEAVCDVDLVILLGTDHNGDDGKITLTRQSYATPYGVLPTDLELVDDLAALVGVDIAFEQELNHRHEHSIELAALWLHHMRDGEPCSLLPILTGSFFAFVQGDISLADSAVLNDTVGFLRHVMARKNAIIVAAADLAHIGPAFGGGRVDAVGRAQLKLDDERLIETICSGDAGRFFATIQAEGDRRNICGLAPIYLSLSALGDAKGELVGYDRCVADAQNTSFVSICGITWSD